MPKRKRHHPAFKAKVALEALMGEATSPRSFASSMTLSGSEPPCWALRAPPVSLLSMIHPWPGSAFQASMDFQPSHSINKLMKPRKDTTMRIQLSMSVIVLSAMVAGCATITTGTGELVTVETDPQGANCALSTENGQVAVINPTPGSIEAPKSRHDLKVRCEKDGFLPTDGVIESQFAPMTLGNVLIGGVIGVAVDAASGAMTQYAPGVSITLTPESFPSEEERRRYFDGLRNDLIASHEAEVKQIKAACGGQASCDSRVATAEEKHEKMLADLEANRMRAKVDAV